MSEAGRPKRLSPLDATTEALGAVFGTKNGWERPDWFRPGEPARRAGEDQRLVGWAKPIWFDRVAVEHAAIRERAGILDMTSFGKLELSELDVLGARVRRAHRPAGRVGRVHAAARRSRADRRRRDGDAARGGSLPRRHRRRGGRQRSGLPGAARRARHRRERRLRGHRAVGAGGARRPRRLPVPARRRRSASAACDVLAQRMAYVGEYGYELYVRARRRRTRCGTHLMETLNPEPVGYRRARLAAHREGLPLLRHRPDRRPIRRSTPGSASRSRRTSGSSSTAIQPRCCGRCSSAGRTT